MGQAQHGGESNYAQNVNEGAGTSTGQPPQDRNRDEETHGMDTAEDMDEDEGFAARYPVRARKRPCTWWRNQREVIARINVAAEIKEPNSYQEAITGPHGHAWKKAMDEEILAQMTNGTWEVGVPPPEVNVLPCRWVYKVKTNPDGSVDRFKARLVAKGCAQREGVDYGELFAPTSRGSSFRALLAVAAARELNLHQLDVSTAFLNGDLKEIWMKQPQGYNSDMPGAACRLIKSIYGLKQASRCWYDKLCEKFAEIGLRPAKADQAMFTKVEEGEQVYVLVHVDDMCIAAREMKTIKKIKEEIGRMFKVRDLGEISTFLGMEVRRCDDGDITLSQSRYVDRILEKHGMKDAKPRVIPVAVGAKLGMEDESEMLTDPTPYRALVGELNYLAVSTRPDLGFALSILSRHMAKPSKMDMGVAKGVLLYVAGTKELGLRFKKEEVENIDGYCDSDWAGDKESRRSTTGYVFRINGTAVSWSSQLQRTVATSSVEAEYQALSAAVREALWLNKLCGDMDINNTRMKIWVYSQGAMNLGKNPINSSRTKHVDVQHHVVRERIARGEVVLAYCRTEEMVADTLTKALPEMKFSSCRYEMGMDVT
ncbi:hypothetical protein VaNZ11_016806 [Volvox africanus]|uniref:Reverse transcriptase Ty1/copia-type domain-containing protein n=1 Tax=Volvox africanus TaxID=51714 RepID=A0ABQ5SPH7_9CHLO|nr:hypothetical protein VaNZ11_016806 [Volvox africanus]